MGVFLPLIYIALIFTLSLKYQNREGRPHDIAATEMQSPRKGCEEVYTDSSDAKHRRQLAERKNAEFNVFPISKNG